MTENNSESKVYTLTDEGLRKLLNQSYRNGVLGAYQTLHDAMKLNIEDDDFENSEQAKGFNYCLKIIEAMMVSATSKMMKNNNNV